VWYLQCGSKVKSILNKQVDTLNTNVEHTVYSFLPASLMQTWDLLLKDEMSLIRPWNGITIKIINFLNLPTIQFSTSQSIFTMIIKNANWLIQNTGEKLLFIVRVVKKYIYAVCSKFLRLSLSTADSNTVTTVQGWTKHIRPLIAGLI
jgi:hypothetical protein